MWFLLVFFSCIYKGGGETLLIAHKNDVLRLDMQNKTIKVVSADSPIVGFDVHVAWRQIYWATDYYIYRTPLYDLRTTTLIAVTGQVGNVAVDWVHNHLYWVDLTARRIEAANIDGRSRRIVYESHNHVSSLVLDPQYGKLFWIESTHAGSKTKIIKSSNFYGSRVKIVKSSTNIPENCPLALDVIYKTLYFYQVNGSYSEQWGINYDGIEPHIKLFERNESSARSLSLSNDGFYYSNDDGLFFCKWVKNSYLLVYGNRTDKFIVLDSYFKLLDQKLTGAKQLRVLNETSQPKWKDKCINNVCEHLCAPVTNSVHTDECGCRYGYDLKRDNKTCFENGYILYSTRTTFGKLKLNAKHNIVLYNDSSAKIQTFDVNIKSGYIYWSDLFHKTIYRAPLDLPNRKQVVISNVSAYGVAIDWLYSHIYWSDESRIMVASLDGEKQVSLLNDLDAPAEIAVDPVNGFIFWVQCGQSLSVKRASLDGSSVQTILDQVSCGTSLITDVSSRTLYWLDWTGSVYTSSYDGYTVTTIHTNQVRAMTLLDHQVLWTPIDETPRRTTFNNNTIVHTQINFFSQNVLPTALKAIKSSQQPGDDYLCVDFNCQGLCLVAQNATVPRCVCADGDGNPVACSNSDDKSEKDGAGSNRNRYIELINSTSFGLTMRCLANLIRHPALRLLIHVKEVDSLVPRDTVSKLSRVVQVTNKTLPFTIDNLNPAMSYTVSVRNRVTKAAFSITVHTPPPPLKVQRLPVITVPGIDGNIKWRAQGIHYFSPNAWEDLLDRKYILLLISEEEHSQANSPTVKQPILDLIKQEVRDNFIILNYYETKEQFDDDPVMYLGNLPWGEEFWLAMVQVTEYKESYNLDIVYSDRFGLPDPYWNVLMEEIFDNQL